MAEVETDFSRSTFDVVKYVQRISTGQTYEKLKRDQANIKELAKSNANNLQNNVYNNYPLYIEASNDISKLESDVQSLKQLLRDKEAACRELQSVTIPTKPEAPLPLFRSDSVISRSDSRAVTPSGDLVPEWLADAPGELDVTIAQRSFEEAVNLAVRVKHELTTRTLSRSPDLRDSIMARMKFLTSTLSQELQRPALQLPIIKSIVAMLVQLGELEEARRMFLINRSNAIVRELRKLKLEGSTDLFVHKHCSIFFGILRSTCQEFGLLFDDMAKSAFMSWAMKELKNFATLFDRQVFQPTTSYDTIANCLDVINQHCRQLRELGLDLEVALWSLLETKTIEAIETQGQYYTLVVFSQIDDESWRQQEFTGKHARKVFLENLTRCQVNNPEQYIDDMTSILCEATTYLHEHTYNFIASSVRLYNPKVGKDIMKYPIQLLPLFLEKLITGADRAKDPMLVETNANFVISIATLVRKRIEEATMAKCPPLRAMEEKLKTRWEEAKNNVSIL
eukprot:m.237909 g.237909  ORF g.237909 m.237909 type:complete len:509 (-) comp16057_c1_seq1:990-2516(-)